MDNIPMLVYYKIYLNLDYEDMISLGQVNKKCNSIIKKDYLWKQKIEQDFSERAKPINSDINYRHVYKVFSVYKKKLENFSFSIEDPDIKYYGYSTFSCKGVSNCQVTSRLLTLGQCKKFLNMSNMHEYYTLYGTYKNGDKIYYIKLERNVFRFDLYFEPSMDINKYKTELKQIICLTEPTYYSRWTAIDEYFDPIIPNQEIFQPYYYFQSKKNYISKRDLLLFNNNNDIHIYYGILFSILPNIKLDNKFLELYQRVKDKEIECDKHKIIPGYYLGLPYIIFIRNNDIYLKISCDNYMPLIDELNKL